LEGLHRPPERPSGALGSPGQRRKIVVQRAYRRPARVVDLLGGVGTEAGDHGDAVVFRWYYQQPRPDKPTRVEMRLDSLQTPVRRVAEFLLRKPALAVGRDFWAPRAGGRPARRVLR